MTAIESELHGIVSFKDQDSQLRLAMVDITKGKIVRTYPIKFLKESEAKIRLVDGHAGSNYFVVTQRQMLYVIDKNSATFIVHNNIQPINVVIVHPEEEIVVTGELTGRIILWRNIFDKNPVKTELHWHHMLVLSLAFSQSGTVLYSGGAECVLVKWQIGEKTITKDFLPRLPGSIKQISVDPTRDRITLSTDDNAIHIISSNLKVLRSIQDFTRISPYNLGTSDPYPAGIQVNPRNHQLVLNGRIGHLQFFSTKTMKLLFNVDISMRNVLPREKKKNNFSTEVTHCAFSMAWMATVESWNDRTNSPDSHLKFWKFDSERQTYSLHTQVEQAHALEIIALEFSSQDDSKNLICATASHDRTIKIWSLEKSEEVKNAKMIWLCIEQLSFKNLPVKTIKFSEDGTLITAGFGNAFCVWDSMSFEMKCVLSAPGSLEGSTNRVVISLAPETTKSSKKASENVQNTVDRRRKLVELMRSVIRGDSDDALVKCVKVDKKKRFFTQRPADHVKPSSLSKAEKEMIFKRVLALQDLNFNQKIDILHKLHIYYKISNRAEQEIIEYMKRNISECHQRYKSLSRNIKSIRNPERFKLQWRFRTWNSLSSKRNRRIVTVRKLLTEKIDGPVLEIQKGKQAAEEANKLLPIKNLTQITNIVFGTDEFSYLAIISTMDRVLIWNLLTLKLNGSFKVHAKLITLDPITNLVAVFTKHNELFIFHPSPVLTIHHQKKMPNVYGAIWVARETPRKQSINVNWQAASQLLFLTEHQEVCALQTPGDDDFANIAAFMEITSNVTTINTPFAAMIAQKVTDETTKDSNGMTKRITVSGSGTVKDVSLLIDFYFISHLIPFDGQHLRKVRENVCGCWKV